MMCLRRRMWCTRSRLPVTAATAALLAFSHSTFSFSSSSSSSSSAAALELSSGNARMYSPLPSLVQRWKDSLLLGELVIKSGSRRIVSCESRYHHSRVPAAISSTPNKDGDSNLSSTSSIESILPSPFLSSSSSLSSARTFQTPVDLYFQQHGRLPRPHFMHRVMEMDVERQHVLVIGDVHGCLDELLLLVDQAVQMNDGVGFDSIVLVGDLVNKGPSSVEVVRHVRSMGWHCVRGNHDEGALLAAVGDERRRSKRRYEWVKDLSDEDIIWMSELPYTIRIRHKFQGRDKPVNEDDDSQTIIVHAGLVPGIDLEKQTIQDMITLRAVVQEENEGGYLSENDRRGDDENRVLVPWASAWKGPGHVIFGHDARRGLQLRSHATGLDSGCCYGKQLTGIILPSRRLVQVEARKVYCPPGVKED